MVKLIAGLKGSGKTKQLIHDINESVKNEAGSMARTPPSTCADSVPWKACSATKSSVLPSK